MNANSQPPEAGEAARIFNSFMLCSRSKQYLDGRGKYGSIANARLFSTRDFDDIQHGFRISLNDGADIVPCEDGPYRPGACSSHAALVAAMESAAAGLNAIPFIHRHDGIDKPLATLLAAIAAAKEGQP